VEEVILLGKQDIIITKITYHEQKATNKLFKLPHSVIESRDSSLQTYANGGGGATGIDVEPHVLLTGRKLQQITRKGAEIVTFSFVDANWNIA
jgi:hypothetical protein